MAMRVKRIEQSIIRKEVSPRGGGIEIDLKKWGYPNGKMTAYQNYLGGGMLGRVDGDCNVPDWKSIDRLNALNEKLKRYYHNLTNGFHADCFWSSCSYEDNQKRQASAY